MVEYKHSTTTGEGMSPTETELPPLPTLPPAGCPMAPAPEFGVLRSRRPISRVALGDGSPVWLLTRHEDVRAVLRDPRFSSVTTRPGFPVYGLPGRDTPEFANAIIRMDAPEHLRLRRMAVGEFVPKRVASYQDDVLRVVTQHLDAIEAAGPPGDFADFALAVPSSMISLLLGVPEEDHEFFQESTREHTRRDASTEEVAASLADLHRYMSRLADTKSANPGDDIITRLVARERAGELTRDQLASYALLLVAAGHDTTAGTMALSILTLVQEPALVARLRERPDLWDRAVEELLRYHSIVRGGPRRLAMEDVEVGGQLIRAGEGVMVSVWAGNHDETHFPHPEVIDVERENAQTHVAFGFGAHQCMGQSLARLELRIGLSEVFRRFPGLHLDRPVTELPFRTDSTNYGLYSLTLNW